MSTIPIILLAAGRSSRMGGTDKLMQKIDGQPLLRRTVKIARAVAPVIVALPPAPHPRHDALAGLDVRQVPVADAKEGMNASLRAALKHVPDTADAAMILLADLPDLTADDLAKVLRSVSENPGCLIWRGSASDGTPGHPVVFASCLFPQLRTLTGDSGAQSVVRAHRDKVHIEPLPGTHATRDLDTPRDWAAWRARRQAKN
ncbi:CTP:molybdopterin cytidylyltransferase MocA [Ruegeria intermedia]|uniref:CTP:molybdopterin cytidylyltransferase MocA n=1 Tax=Ruegeria intermedia TaxID=996115 RepID=A0A1M4XE04_9RHOB|nr:nucleotidyltransferase family protein [Ruegeria intermedia]SHE91685.1 CTP:molybdopterin cytidylyltransferase MocA [Ruegeria intermedia]